MPSRMTRLSASARPVRPLEPPLRFLASSAALARARAAASASLRVGVGRPLPKLTAVLPPWSPSLWAVVDDWSAFLRRNTGTFGVGWMAARSPAGVRLPGWRPQVSRYDAG